VKLSTHTYDAATAVPSEIPDQPLFASLPARSSAIICLLQDELLFASPAIRSRDQLIFARTISHYLPLLRDHQPLFAPSCKISHYLPLFFPEGQVTLQSASICLSPAACAICVPPPRCDCSHAATITQCISRSVSICPPPLRADPPVFASSPLCKSASICRDSITESLVCYKGLE
jgi:hypothetical protein